MTIKHEYIKRIWDEKAIIIQKKPIVLKSRRKSHVYVNHRNFICLPKNMKIILSLFEAELKKAFDQPYALSNVDSSVSPILIGPLSLRMDIPFYFYRPASGEKGLSEDIFTYDYNPSSSSTFAKRSPAVLIDDVVTTTTTLRTTAQSLRSSGIGVIGSVILLDRRIEYEKKDEPVKISSVVLLTEVLEYGMHNLDLSDEYMELLEIELHQLRM